jgi:hypothetical protein
LPEANRSVGNDIVTIPFRVTRTEYLGGDRLLYGTLAGAFAEQKVIARLPSTVNVGLEKDKVYDFAIEKTQLKFFDHATDRRITAPHIDF